MVRKKRKKVVDLSDTGIVDVPTPADIEYAEALEKSKKKFTVDEILRKHNSK